MIGPELNAFRRQIGLSPVDRILTRWGHSPQMVIGLFPAWFAAPQPDWPPHTHLTGFPLFEEDGEVEMAPEVQAFLAAGEPPIVFMPGSLMKYADRFFETAVQATQFLKQRAILLSRSTRQIPKNLPDTIRHFDYVPFQRLLPHAKLLVHHGGVGTCAQALQAGIPQLIHPMAYDQLDNAWRLRKLGIGDWIKPKDWHKPILTEKLTALTTDSQVREQCQLIALKFNETAPLMETCKLIESQKPF
jgi:UDP:flavonoid glycosyltransferase YjiC (YdhE family)